MTIMKNLWSLLAVLSVVVFSMCFTSCGGDDDDSFSNDSDEVECWSCQGSGQCHLCDGTGKKDCLCVGIDNGKCWACKGKGRDPWSDTCWLCHGSGLCDDCYGTLKMPCDYCDGSGICEECGGIGRLPGNGDNGNDDNGGSGGGGNGDNGGNGGGSTKRKCVICGGSGKCEAPSLGYISNKQYCWGNGKCRPCNGTGQQSNPFTGDYYACTYCNKEINKYYGDGICGKCGGSGKCHNCGGDGYK